MHQWQDMSRRMFVPFHDDGIISQFEGYEELQELDLDGYRARYGDIQRLDRILRAEGDDPDRYKISKQADAVMSSTCSRPARLAACSSALTTCSRPTRQHETSTTTTGRTSHGSTLASPRSPTLAALDPEKSWERFLVALRSDPEDIQRGTTQEGIHIGVMAGP